MMQAMNTAPRRIRLSALAAILLLAGAGPASAGSGTSESIISRQDAIAGASSGMASGDQITGTRCTTMIRDLSARYRCTVTWGPATP